MTKPIVQEYQEYMFLLGFHDRFGFVSMEGFLSGLFFTKIMEQFTNEEIDNLQQEEFLEKVYELQTIELYDISLGPYIKEQQMTTSNNIIEGFCNTGLREAWICYYDNEEDTIEVSPDSKTFPYCSGDTDSRNDLSTFIRSPIFFGFSNNLNDNKTKEFGISLELGLSSKSTEEINNNLYLINMDHEGDQEKVFDNLEWFDDIKNVFAYVGFDQSWNTGIRTKHLIGTSNTVFGADARESNILYFRPFILDEIYNAVQYYREKNGVEPFVLIDWK